MIGLVLFLSIIIYMRKTKHVAPGECSEREESEECSVCEAPGEEPKPMLFLKVYTKTVWPGQGHGDWFPRNAGIKNKIKIINHSEKVLKVKTKPHALFNSVSAKDISCVCNTEYDEGEETLHDVKVDTHRCNIEIMDGENRVFKKLCSSSEDVIIEEKTVMFKNKFKRTLFSCCTVPRAT